VSYLPPVAQLASELDAIYKYVPVRNQEELARARAMIADRSLWFWHITGQNDERECRPEVFYGGAYEDLYRYFINDFRLALPTVDLEVIEQQARRAARNPQLPKPEQVYRNWAICCFSAAGDCPYLWREYGAAGAGIMVEYPTLEGSPAGLAGKVNYADEPVRLDLLNLDESVMYKVFTTKRKQWSREREYRLVERLEEPFSGRSFIYGDLRISSVSIGARLQAAFAEHIRRVCRGHGIEVKDAQLGPAADRALSRG
jgi:hypothetical protein